MRIENITKWGEYDLFRASFGQLSAYGTTASQAINNLLGQIYLLNWNNYAQSL